MPEHFQPASSCSVDALLRDMTNIIDRLDEAGLTAAAARMAMAIDAYEEELRPEGFKWRKLGVETGECG
jgi:hypothetical protein